MLKKRLFLISASVLALAGPAYSQASIANSVSLWGLDSVSHTLCVVGLTLTCQIPTSGSTTGGGGAVFGPTAVGTAAANPPVLIGGTIDGTATGAMVAALIDSSHNLHTQEANSAAMLAAAQAGTAAYGGAMPSSGIAVGGADSSTGFLTKFLVDHGTGGLDVFLLGGTATVVGGAANNASPSGNPVQGSGIAVSTEPPPATNGQNAVPVLDLAHKLITLPYANPENIESGTSSSIAATPGTSMLAAAGAGLFHYITSFSCFNTTSTATTVQITNGSGGSVIWQGEVAATVGAGFAKDFPAPIGGKSLTANTAVFVYAGTGAALMCNISGYKGS
ncbi:MAG: hypothetical protein JWP75_418 [Frondihabitans sp.]|nr:hypothetical protein [Frondihabitans sp.]